jgi:CHAD domain-containing protein
MNSVSIHGDEQPVLTVQTNWQRQVGDWRDLLAQCAHKPSRKRVHALRSLTLRLSRTLEFHLAERPTEPAATRAFRRWKKEGKKLRRTLEPVRDADVYVARLSCLHDTQAVSTTGEPHLNPRCRREIDKLENRLKHRRQKGIDELMVTLAARCKRLKRLSEEMEAALKLQNPSVIGSTAQAALWIFKGLAGELSGLEAANLHSFRKHVKQALYLAEISAPFDPEARRLFAVFRKMHVAIGDWHDWQTLSLKARRILPGRARKDGAVSLLENLANEALKRTLDLCRSVASDFLEDTGETQLPPPRKPVTSVSGGDKCIEFPSFRIAG